MFDMSKQKRIYVTGINVLKMINRFDCSKSRSRSTKLQGHSILNDCDVIH